MSVEVVTGKAATELRSRQSELRDSLSEAVDLAGGSTYEGVLVDEDTGEVWSCIDED